MLCGLMWCGVGLMRRVDGLYKWLDVMWSESDEDGGWTVLCGFM